jgi:hypothetical protein
MGVEKLIEGVDQAKTVDDLWGIMSGFARLRPYAPRTEATKLREAFHVRSTKLRWTNAAAPEQRRIDYLQDEVDWLASTHVA